MKIHLFNPLENLAGGSEWRTIELFRFLKPYADVKIWSRRNTIPDLPEDVMRHTETLTDNHYPVGGNFIFVGCYQHIGAWINKTRSDRTIIIYNTDTPRKLANVALRLPILGAKVEMVYASEYMKKSIGDFEGPVHPSLVDLHRFSPNTNKNLEDTFTVGRLSRDVPEKHHPKDHLLYEALSKQGIHVKIMGGASWSGQVGQSVSLYPEKKFPAHTFMNQLDCFYYRTNDAFFEPSGRVILEAMASGLVVVAHYKGGYREYIDHGKDGFLFKDQVQAYKLIQQLKRDRAMCLSIGVNARKKVENIFSEDNLKKMRDFYLS